MVRIVVFITIFIDSSLLSEDLQFLGWVIFGCFSVTLLYFSMLIVDNLVSVSGNCFPSTFSAPSGTGLSLVQASFVSPRTMFPACVHLVFFRRLSDIWVVVLLV